MVYLDTSFVTPLILPEATSDRVAGFLEGLPVGSMAVSHWTRVEFSSLLGRVVRMGELSARDAMQADARFETLVEESLVVLSPGPDDFSLAKQFLGGYEAGLRAGDALHLAIARRHLAEAVYSLDKTMIRAGRSLGIPVETGIAIEGYAD